MSIQIPTTRLAQAVTRFGGPDVFSSARLDLPDLTPGQVLVRVSAAAVNPVDLTTRAGVNIPVEEASFPMVLGWDFAGTVAAVGAGVTGIKIGAPVAGMTFQPLDQNGTYADHVVLDAELAVTVPGGLPPVQAATVPLAGLTATQLLEHAALPTGATLVLDGALGAVGAFVVQLARIQGLRVVAVVRPDRRADALALGADEAIGPDDLLTRTGSADGGIDLVGGTLAHRLLAAVVDGGAYVTSVPPYIDATGPFEPTRGITPAVLTVAPDRQQLTALLALAAAGRLTTPVDRTFPLTEAAAAHAHAAGRGLHGKVVLIP